MQDRKLEEILKRRAGAKRKIKKRRKIKVSPEYWAIVFQKAIQDEQHISAP